MSAQMLDAAGEPLTREIGRHDRGWQHLEPWMHDRSSSADPTPAGTRPSRHHVHLSR
jgi:hypothetical protein